MCFMEQHAADLRKAADHGKTCKDCKPDKLCSKAEKLVDTTKYEIAYNRVANMKDCHWITALCKTCRPKFEKKKDFIDWLEPSTK